MTAGDRQGVSFQDAREDYRFWRWRLEVGPAQRFERAWVAIASSSLSPDTQIRLMDVVWAASAFERAYRFLLEDILRIESAKAEGVPALMRLLTGSYADSPERLLAISVWMDLGDVFVAYRTIAKRLECCKRHPFSEAEIRRETGALEQRRLLELSPEPLTRLAGQILHTTWDPTGQRELAIKVYWKGPNKQTLDFAEGDVRESLGTLVEETLEQVEAFVTKVIEGHHDR